MNIRLISCWFETSFGDYTAALRKAMERRLGADVGVIATNCGCGDPVEVNRQFQDGRCEFFEFPHVQQFKSANPVKYWLRTQARQLLSRERAKRFMQRSGDAEVLHFQQVLNAFGSQAVFNWLSLPTSAARVVTVHELDPTQQDFPETNRKYNLADRVIVHAIEMKRSLVSLGVDEDRIDVVEHGVEIQPDRGSAREGIVFYGGHKIHSGKGLETLFKAFALVRQRMGAIAPVLKIHGHYGTDTPDYGIKSAQAAGVADGIRWLNQISIGETISEYQRSLLCVLPYTGSFAGYPAVNAMANGVPVIATRRAGLPDVLADTGVWVEPDDAEMLANSIVDLLDDRQRREDLAVRARSRAESLFSWDVIAERTLESYGKAIRAKSGLMAAAH